VPGPRHTRRAVAALTAAASLFGLCVALAAPAGAATFVTTNARRAVAYANARGERAAVAVLDTRTGKFYGAGPYNRQLATESVVKVFIATRLLLTGKMHGSVEKIAYKMITRSDDRSANALYGLAGGDGVEPWIERHYHLPHLGSRPSRGGWWGNTHVTAKGLVRFYAKVKADRRVGPWLLHAMRHATRYGSDGTYQYFGIPAAAGRPFAIKQGWGADSNCSCVSVFNSTGFVQHDRFAVAMLTSGGSYGRHAMTTLNGMARRLMPGGHLDSTWHNPVLKVSTTRLSKGIAHFAGYTYDRDAPARRLTVSVYDNGDLVLRRPTDRMRSGVNQHNHLTGRHGFDIRVSLADGVHHLVLRVVNVKAGTHGRSVHHTWRVGRPSGTPTPPPTTPPPTTTPPTTTLRTSTPPAASVSPVAAGGIPAP
jgi:hypothetical protein